MSEEKQVTRLTGHFSPETAYLVDDYPYGFVLRCKIRYWVEYKPSHGFRFVSQTSNPKKAGLVWNKPKPGTYSKFGAVMLRGINGHISYTSLGIYSDAKEARTWFDRNGAFLEEAGRVEVQKWVEAKEAYETKQTEGFTAHEAGVIASAQRQGVEFSHKNEEGRLVFKKAEGMLNLTLAKKEGGE